MPIILLSCLNQWCFEYFLFLQIYEHGRINFTVNQSNDEKVQTLLRERRMLEQRLEETHLHLSDIKSTWSAQNMALETQVDRLSRQVAAETTEKRKAITAHDDLAEKCKQLTFQLEKAQADIEQRDQKVCILSTNSTIFFNYFVTIFLITILFHAFFF